MIELPEGFTTHTNSVNLFNDTFNKSLDLAILTSEEVVVAEKNLARVHQWEWGAEEPPLGAVVGWKEVS